MFALKLALRPWRLSALSQWLSSFTFGVLLLILGFLVWFGQALTPVIQRMSNEQVVTAYLDGTQGVVHPTKVMDGVRAATGKNRDVKMEYVSSENFMQELQKSYPDLAREVASLGSDMKLIAPQFIAIRGELTPEEIDRVRRVPGVESIDMSKERYRPIAESFSALRWITRLFALAVLGGLFTMLLLMARLNQTIHQDAAQLVRQLGGSDLESRLPQILNLGSIGCLGVVLAVASWQGGVGWFAARIHEFSPFFAGIPAPRPIYLLLIAAFGIGFGLLTGLLTSSPNAVRKGRAV